MKRKGRNVQKKKKNKNKNNEVIKNGKLGQKDGTDRASDCKKIMRGKIRSQFKDKNGNKAKRVEQYHLCMRKYKKYYVEV